jgi:hypothetical protein
MDTDDNYNVFVNHVAAAQPGQFLVRQRPRDKGNYLLCAKPPAGTPVMLSAKWSEERGMYEVSDGMRHLFVIDGISAFVEVCSLEGIEMGDVGKVQLSGAALGYVPAPPGVNTPKALPADAASGRGAAASATEPIDGSAIPPGGFADELAKLSAEIDALVSVVAFYIIGE